jgi:hypothetical protein
MEDDKRPSKMGNFTSVVGDLKSAPPGQTYEMNSITQGSRSTESPRSSATMDMPRSGPVTIGSLQNKSWFPDDEVLMTRRVNVFDEEAAEWPQPLRVRKPA